MASADLTLKIKPDITEFEIAIFRSRLEIAKAEAEFWDQQLQDALVRRG